MGWGAAGSAIGGWAAAVGGAVDGGDRIGKVEAAGGGGGGIDGHGARPRVRVPRQPRRRRRVAPRGGGRRDGGKAAGHRVALTRAASAPSLHLELTVDDAPLAIFASKDPSDASGVYVVRGNQWVRVEARRKPTCPSSARRAATCSTSSGRSPTTGAPRGTRADLAPEGIDARLAALGARLTGEDVSAEPIARCLVPYVSESAILEAVELILAHPPVRERCRRRARGGGGEAERAPTSAEREWRGRAGGAAQSRGGIAVEAARGAGAANAAAARRGRG